MSLIYDLEPGFKASQTFDFSLTSVSDIFFTWYLGGLLCVQPDEEKLIPTEFIKREKNKLLEFCSINRFIHEKMGHLSI